jgi:hypothetical protein
LRVILFSHKCGQLGNRLFAFSHLIANAKASNYRIVNLSFDEYSPYFKTTHEDVLCRFPAQKSLIRSGRLRNWLFVLNKAALKMLRILGFRSSGVHALIIADQPEYDFHKNVYYDLKNDVFQNIVHRKVFTLLFGRFFRDYANFEKHQEAIRDYFTPTDKITENVSTLLEKARAGSDVLVGVHIRGGDYREFAGGRYYYTQLAYHQKMVEVSQEIRGKVHFLICSNEATDEQIFGQLTFFTGTGHLVEDMYALAGCDLIMGPPSTFSRWASFYGKKPLYHIMDISEKANAGRFVMLPSQELYNF